MDVDAPPLIVGFSYRPFLLIAERPEFRCGIHATAAGFPMTREPVYRGEVPEGAECSICGIGLKELE